MFTRVALLLVVNGLVMLTLSALLSLLGVQPYLREAGVSPGALLASCLVWGMGGAFVSLWLSRFVAKRSLGVALVGGDDAPAARQLQTTVHRLAARAGLPAMPEVGIYEGAEINAFATGPTQARALVAVSRGLLEGMDTAEVEGVLAHEISHIVNGDMVTMTLLQGVVNAFAMFLSRALALAVGQALRGSRDDEDGDRGRGGSPVLAFVLQLVLEAVFMFLGAIVVAAFSRRREYRADAGGAQLAAPGAMVRALQRLQAGQAAAAAAVPAAAALQTLMISGRPSGLMALFASHPPLAERIARLQGRPA